MAQFTATIGEICEGLSGAIEPIGGSMVEATIAACRPLIFDFPYPFYTEGQKQQLETNIIRHFWNREIGFETYGLWKLKLSTRLNEIMPMFVRMYDSEDIITDPLGNANYHETIGLTENGNNSSQDNSNTTVNNEGETTVNTTREGKSEDKFSDTPQGGLTGVESGEYLTNARIVDTNDTDAQTTKTGSQSDTTDQRTSNGKYNLGRNTVRELTGKTGGESNAETLMKYRETFLNIDLMIIHELEDLFMGVWEPAGGAV